MKPKLHNFVANNQSRLVIPSYLWNGLPVFFVVGMKAIRNRQSTKQKENVAPFFLWVKVGGANLKR